MNDENVILSEASVASVVEESFEVGRRTKDPSTALRVTAYFLSKPNNPNVQMVKMAGHQVLLLRLEWLEFVLRPMQSGVGHWNLLRVVGSRNHPTQLRYRLRLTHPTFLTSID
ncbi:MAG: hypothetical protein HY673_03345 [Chloroflexi bacterium]|nr:hypothetical protein [Chloroflexota bacterium]